VIVNRVALAFLAALALASVVGCQDQRGEDPPILPERNMFDTERYNPESFSQFFADHRTMRTPVAGTIARESYEDRADVRTGLDETESGYVMTIPQTVVNDVGGLEKLVNRGQERFNIYCAPCHGQTGDGKGMVVCKRERLSDPCQSRGFGPLPSYEDPRLRQMPDGQIFATITHGVRTMPAYGPQIPIPDRWAIVSYVRALEMSQMADAKPSQPELKK
jgi:mono/diheme cytochrome c family protein